MERITPIGRQVDRWSCLYKICNIPIDYTVINQGNKLTYLAYGPSALTLIALAYFLKAKSRNYAAFCVVVTTISKPSIEKFI